MADVRTILASRVFDSKKELVKTMFYSESFKHIKAVAVEYYETTQITLEDQIKGQFSKNNKHILTAVVLYVLNPADYYAYVLNRSLKFFSKLDPILCTLGILLRQTVEIDDVKESFKRRAGTTLRNAIIWKTGTHFREALLKLIGERIRD